jgi:hypothetical protein
MFKCLRARLVRRATVLMSAKWTSSRPVRMTGSCRQLPVQGCYCCTRRRCLLSFEPFGQCFANAMLRARQSSTRTSRGRPPSLHATALHLLEEDLAVLILSHGGDLIQPKLLGYTRLLFQRGRECGLIPSTWILRHTRGLGRATVTTKPAQRPSGRVVGGTVNSDHHD